jgi:hypothetical protein
LCMDVKSPAKKNIRSAVIARRTGADPAGAGFRISPAAGFESNPCVTYFTFHMTMP